jgi:hypothetical protein
MPGAPGSRDSSGCLAPWARVFGAGDWGGSRRVPGEGWYTGAQMHKAVARHTLRQAGWTEPEITLVTRVLRHDSCRGDGQVLRVLSSFRDLRSDPAERGEWDGLVARVEGDPQLAPALWALLAI